MAKGSVTLMTPLPFEIKTEPVENENNFVAKEIQVTTATSAKSSGSRTATIDYEERIANLEERFFNMIQQVTRDKAAFSKTIDLLSSRCDKVFEDLKRQLCEINSADKPLIDVSVNDLAGPFTDYRSKIADLEQRLEQKTKECRAAEKKVHESTERHDLLMKSLTKESNDLLAANAMVEEMAHKARDIEKQLRQKEDDYMALNDKLRQVSVDWDTEKQMTAKSVEEMKSQHATEVQELKLDKQHMEEKYETEISTLNGKLRQVNSVLAAEKQTAEQTVEEMKSQHRSTMNTCPLNMMHRSMT